MNPDKVDPLSGDLSAAAAVIPFSANLRMCPLLTFVNCIPIPLPVQILNIREA